MRHTTAKIQNTPPQKKTARLFDGRGLYLEIAPTGSRWWRFKYRFAGKEKRISLGVYPDVGLKKARDRRDEMRRLVADGIDPSAARKQEKLMALDAALNTFEAVAREWFEKYSPNWEASYSKKLLARVEANIFPSRRWPEERCPGARRPKRRQTASLPGTHASSSSPATCHP